MLLTLRGSVFIEALLNDRIQFSRQEWDILVEQRLNNSLDGKPIQILARVPDLMKRSKTARSKRTFSMELTDLKIETNALRKECKTVVTIYRDGLRNFDAAKVPNHLKPHLHAHQLRMLGLQLTAGLILDCVLVALNGPASYDVDSYTSGDIVNDQTSIREESSQWSDEILQLSGIAKIYQPLGALLFLQALVLAWICARDAESREKTKALLMQYEKACLGGLRTDWEVLLEQRRLRFMLEDPWPNNYDRYNIACGLPKRIE